MKIFSDITNSRAIHPVMAGKITSTCLADNKRILNNTVLRLDNFLLYKIYKVVGVSNIQYVSNLFFPEQVYSLNGDLQILIKEVCI